MYSAAVCRLRDSMFHGQLELDEVFGGTLLSLVDMPRRRDAWRVWQKVNNARVCTFACGIPALNLHGPCSKLRHHTVPGHPVCP